MDDRTVLAKIDELLGEERRMQEQVSRGDVPHGDPDRLAELEMAIGQWWDYLRQRRAARAAGRDPDTADLRPPEEVARYLQ